MVYILLMMVTLTDEVIILKKTIIMSVLFLSIISTISLQVIKGKENVENIVQKQISLLEAAGGDIEEWHLFSNEVIGSFSNESDRNHTLQSYQSMFPSVDWKVTKHSDHMTLKGSKSLNDNSILTITISSYLENHKHTLALVKEIRGQSSWTKQSQQLVQEYFTHSEELYTNVTATYPLQENIDSMKNQFLTTLRGSVVESLEEDSFISISGYTHNWESTTLQSNGKPLNYQLGIRQSENRTVDVTIGSPIITIEY